MNELLFLAHIAVISICTVLALRISKEALVAVIAIYCVLANLFVLKQITLFGLHPTASDAFSVGAILGLNLLQEYFGKSAAKKAMWTCLLALVLYTITSQIHLMYLPSIYDVTAQHYAPILQFMPRIAIASILVTLVVQYLDRILYGFLKTTFDGKRFFLRNLISLILIQIIDTVLFSFAGLYGIISNISDVILVSFTVKFITIAVSVPLTSLFRKKAKI